MSTIVTTQEELDDAIRAGAEDIVVDAPRDVWITLTGSSSVTAQGNSRVTALGSSRVTALGSSHVEAQGNSRVTALGSSRVTALGSSHVEARGNSRVTALGSSRVEARDSSSVKARESSSVKALDSSRVEAWGFSHVEAWGFSHVEAWNSSHVVACDSSRVEARDYSRVTAGRFVAVHVWSQDVTLSGGVLIDMTTIDRNDPHQWCDLCGVKVTDGKAILYKAVHDDWCTDRGEQWCYRPGETVTADDYNTKRECGGGLHLSPSPNEARAYLHSATRFVACEVDISELIPLEDKCKVRSVRVLHEVDEWGDQVGDDA